MHPLRYGASVAGSDVALKIGRVVAVRIVLARMNVDLIIEDAPDTVTIQQEQFEILALLAKRLAAIADPHITPIRTGEDEEWFVLFAGSLSFCDLKEDATLAQANRGLRQPNLGVGARLGPHLHRTRQPSSAAARSHS